MKNYHNNPLPPLKFDKNRFRVKECPCGRSNKDGKFSPYEGHDDKGYCHSCSVKFLPDLPKSYESYNTYTQRTYYNPKLTMYKPTSFIETDIFKQSLDNCKDNYCTDYLFNLFNKHGEGIKIVQQLMKTYFIGTSDYWQGSTVFWQIDIDGKIRTGKIMLYDPITGKRVKKPKDLFQWVHCMLQLPSFNLEQCLFGEHLLKIDKAKPIAIVESEKTALIASIYLPQFIWLAVGGLTGLKAEKCKVLQGRHVTLFPDLSKPIPNEPTAFERWSEKAVEFSSLFPNTTFTISNLLERRANEEERKQGLDLADYLVQFDYKDFILSEPTSTVEKGIQKNYNIEDHTEPSTTEIKEDFSPEINITLDDISIPCATTTKLTEQFNHFEMVTMQLNNGKYLDCLFDKDGELVEPNIHINIIQQIEQFFDKTFVQAIIDEQHCLINWYSEPPKTNVAVVEKSTVTNQKDDMYKKEIISTTSHANSIEHKASAKDWTKDIEELEQYFSSITLPTAPIGLSQGMIITDSSAFIQSHLATVKANNGKQTFLPYLDRLKALKRYLMSSFKELLV